MQFIKNGPDIPERLLQAHEDGRVVFFCGAGISYPAQLPTFSGLVNKLYSALEPNPSPVQQAAIKAKQYDTAIGLLEGHHGIVVGREKVRKELVNILKPDFSAPNALATHEALLKLARLRDNRVRLITTNFDRVFEKVIELQGLSIERFQAPLLPVPKHKWDGLVYLHGLLSSEPKISELYRLVLSSGDFGLAYLTERWASRFISDLFRNYTVCFVGYSINDPVLRYMMDALAADQQLGESPPEMFAFGSYSSGQEAKYSNEWQAKNVTPILYAHNKSHSYLHKTLVEWAKIYQDGVLGKEQIVTQFAVNPPMASTIEDNYIGRILWAISDKSGLPAKRFASLNPVPPIEWLEPLTYNFFEHQDLSRFGVPPKTQKDEKLKFSLLRRPCPYTHTPYMVLVSNGLLSNKWDFVMQELAAWLLRHLDEPMLILWIAKHGGLLHEEFARLITRKIAELDKLPMEELNRISRFAPKAIPGPVMRTLWRLVLSGRLKSYARRGDLYGWFDRLKEDGLSTSLRLELREILSPYVDISEPFKWEAVDEGADTNQQVRISDLVRYEVVLSVDHPHSIFQDHKSLTQWQTVLPELLLDFSALLRDLMDLKRELGGADQHSDASFSDQPSISEHFQNRDFHDWTIVIELARDAWLAMAKINVERALLVAVEWWHIPYPIFKRLAFFTASQDSVVSTSQACEWILSENCWWLWSEEVRREMLRLLVALAPRLNGTQQLEVEQAILLGPPRHMYMEGIDEEAWQRTVDRSMWIRLAKIQASGGKLSRRAKLKLNKLQRQYPNLRIFSDERDEFPIWMESGTGEIDETFGQYQITPIRRKDLVAWLKEHPSSSRWDNDDWRIRCGKNFSTTACALYKLAHEEIWPSDRWREALQAWSEEKLLRLSWRHMAPIIINAPDELIEKCANGLSWWLQTIAKTFIGHEEIFIQLIERILGLEYDESTDVKDPVNKAINHPVGLVTEALLRWLYRKSLKDGQGLNHLIKPIFTRLCNRKINKYQHGRVVLASNVIYLFRVDAVWATENLLPLFDWQSLESEALIAWKGFLRSPRLYWPLLIALKKPYLDTASHFSELGDHAVQYADLLTFSCLELGDSIPIKGLALATRTLPPEGLKQAAFTLARALEGAGEQRGEYWKNRILPYLKFIWPKSSEYISAAISENLARVCIAADDFFPEALIELKSWLIPIEHPDYVIHLLEQSKLSEAFPEPVLDFIDRIISNDLIWVPSDQHECLNAIVSAAPNLKTDSRYLRLAEYIRRNN